jgi:GT2 family glycosyltransferase
VDGQSELVRSLRKQLEETERELLNQKWVFERFLESPSWRMTYPIRWAVKQIRNLLSQASPSGRGERASEAGALGEGNISDAVQTLKPSPYPLPEGKGTLHYLKELLAPVYRATLLNFLSSATTLPLPNSKNPQISVVLVLYNRAELTLQCLRSIVEHGFPNLEVLIVDNASTDETAQLLERAEGARVIRNNDNRNFVLAVNQAAREAQGEYLLLLNNDTQLLPGALQSALRTIQGASNIGAVGGRLVLLDWSLQEAGSIVWDDASCLGYGRGDNPFAPMYMFRRDVDYCSAAFLLTPRERWRELGGFDEIFKPAYYEDSDYCVRLWERGLRVVYDPDVVVLHYEFGSSTKTADAIELQRNHQKIFLQQHRSWLSQRQKRNDELILLARTANANKRVLFIEDRVPHPWLGSGFPRACSILLSLLKQGFSVTFYPMTDFEESWTDVYSDMPHEVEFMMGYGPPLLEPFLRHRHSYYDLIVVSRPHNMKILQPFLSEHPEWFRNRTFIYDAEAIFATREITAREVSGKSLPPQEAEAMVREEVELARLANHVLSVSREEQKQFERYGVPSVHVVGHCVAPAPTPRPFSQRKGLLFAGAIYEEATPNADSIIWFLEEIFPKIQERLGSISLTIAGVNKSERVAGLAGSSVCIAGQVKDLTGFYDSARIFIAPTRFSAGIPQKIHDAAARGLPIVATPLLANQLGWADGSPILVGGDAETFAAKCVELYQDEGLWNRLREAGIERIKKECSPELFEDALQSIIENGHRAHARGNA